MAKKIPNISPHNLGKDTLFLIAGPCVIEQESVMLKTAGYLAQLQEKLSIPIIYKSSFQKDNRSDLTYYQGPGLEKGLKLLEKIKKQFKLLLLSDIHYPTQAQAAAEVLDIIQIPAYLCMQTDLLVSAAKTHKIINIKRGQFLSPQNIKYPIKKITDCGNNNIIITERGYTFGYNDLVVDPRSFFHLKQTGYPIVFDVTHSIRKYGIPSKCTSGGSPEYLPTLARSSVAAGVNGLFIEVHPHPSKALCDAASQMYLYHLEKFMTPLLAIHNTIQTFVV